MSDKLHVTDFNYLDVSVKPMYPKFLHKVVNGFMGKGTLPIIKILGPLLGFGISKGGVKRYPEQMLILEDGTKLATDVFVPKKVFKSKSKAPTIIVRLPYWKDQLSILGFAFAAYGYVVVMQDTRGCAHSEGFNFFLQTERVDGFELLNWITKQYWYNGKMGMVGGSYFGLTQLALSWDNGLLTCIAPAVCSYSNIWLGNGGLKIHALSTSIYRIMLNIVLNSEPPHVDILTKEIQELYLNPRYALYNEPIKPTGNVLKFSDFVGMPLKHQVKMLSSLYKVKNWDLSQKNLKVYFRFLEDFLKLKKDIVRMPGMMELDFSKLSQPAYFLTGWQDMFMDHTLNDFLELKSKANNEAGKYSKLIIGPYAHADKGHPEGNILKFGVQFLNKRWFECWLKDKKNAYPDLERPSIKYYTYGARTWRYTESWPPKGVKYEKMYVHSKSRAVSKHGDGTLSFEKPREEPLDYYMFNPIDPVITRGGRNLGILKGCQNQKKSEKRTDVLVFTSEPLTEGIEVTGLIKMVLYASSSAEDTDFMVKLCDIYPKGKSLNIVDSGIRARFRDGESVEPSLIEPGKIYKYEFNLGSTSIYFQPGHRIRVDITSSNFPRFDINSNLGGKEDEKGYAIADQKIYHDSKNPSHIILPIVSKK